MQITAELHKIFFYERSQSNLELRILNIIQAKVINIYNNKP